MNPFTKARFDVGANLNSEPKQILKFEVKPGQIQETTTSIHVDKEIYVAIGPSFTASRRPIYPHVRRSIPTSGREDLGTNFAERLQAWRLIDVSSCGHVTDPN